MILSVEQIAKELNDLVLEGLNQYTSFVCEERFTKCEVLTNLMATVTLGVKERLPTMCDQLRDAINLHVVSAMLKICREKFDRFPHTKELTNVEVISPRSRRRSRMRWGCNSRRTSRCWGSAISRSGSEKTFCVTLWSKKHQQKHRKTLSCFRRDQKKYAP